MAQKSPLLQIKKNINLHNHNSIPDSDIYALGKPPTLKTSDEQWICPHSNRV